MPKLPNNCENDGGSGLQATYSRMSSPRSSDLTAEVWLGFIFWISSTDLTYSNSAWLANGLYTVCDDGVWKLASTNRGGAAPACSSDRDDAPLRLSRFGEGNRGSPWTGSNPRRPSRKEDGPSRARSTSKASATVA